MRHLNLFIPKMTLAVFICTLIFSCSKDTDLLSEYVIHNTTDITGTYGLLVNDTYYSDMTGNIVLDVLNNDNFENLNNVTVIGTSDPKFGSVVINEDNTITYTPHAKEDATEPNTAPPDTEEQVVDTFNYVAEEKSAEGEVITAEATVTVSNIENKAPTSGPNVFYVTTNGKSTNTGKTESSSWEITHAFKTAKAGDIIHIKAGQYLDVNIMQDNDGTSSDPIKFIGYNTSPGDIDADSQRDFTLGTQTIKVLASFSYGDSVDSTKMPLIQEIRNGSVGTGTAITIRGSNVHVSNIQTLYYENGLYNHGDNNQMKNLIHVDLGNFSKDVRDGNGIMNYGDNCSFKNIYVENAADQGFSIRGNNGKFDAISVVADDAINATDYYFLFQEGHDNLATNIYNFRKGNLQHRGHGITYKTPDECYNNTTDKFIIDNTRAEVQFPGVHDNLLKNGYIRQTASSQNGGGLRLANGAYNNTYSNIFIENSTIYFMDWNDGLAGDVDNDSSDGNIFNQITVVGGKDCVSFNFYGDNFTNSSADNNIFYNCTFYNNYYMFEDSRKNSNTKFINCIFTDIKAYSHTATGYSSNDLDIEISNSNVFNLDFNVPEISDLMKFDPQFVNPNSKDFYLKNNSPLQNKGVATPFLDSGNDLGAFQN